MTTYGVCENIGQLPFCKCCNKEVKTVSMQIGLGPTLFLMSTKAFAWIFFVLSIINIPLFILYLTGNQQASQLPSSDSFFPMLSIGNIGPQEWYGNYANLETGKVSMMCPLGYIDRLRVSGRIEVRPDQYFDFDEVSLWNTEQFVEEKCRGESMLDTTPITKEQLQALLGPPVAEETLDEEVTLPMTEEDQPQEETQPTDPNAPVEEVTPAPENGGDRRRRRLQGDVVFENSLTSKDQEDLLDLFSSNEELYSKDRFQLVFDFECQDYKDCEVPLTTSLWSFKETCVLGENQWVLVIAICDQTYYNAVTGSSISSDTLAIYIVGFNLLTVVVLALFIWMFEVSQEKYINSYKDTLIEMTDFTISLTNLPPDYHYGGKEEQLRAYLTLHFEGVIQRQMIKRQLCTKADLHTEEMMKHWQVVDINFGKARMKQIEPLTKMSEYRNKYLLAKNLKKPKCKTQKMKDKVLKQMTKLETKFDKQTEVLKEINFNEEHGIIKNFDREDPNVRFANIVFRSMDAIEHLTDAYNKSKCYRFWVSCCCSCMCERRQRELRQKHFFKQWPIWSRACLPDEIEWSNVSTSNKSRNYRVCFVWLMVLFVMFASLVGIMYVCNYSQTLEEEWKLYGSCPEDVLKEDAWTEQFWNVVEQDGLMNCYCKTLTKEEIQSLTFTEFNLKDGNPDERNYCQEWHDVEWLLEYLRIGIAFAVVLLNFFSIIILEKFTAFEKRPTANEKSRKLLFKSTIVPFVNIAILITVANKDFGFYPEGIFFDYVPIFQGWHSGYDSIWYTRVGETICWALAVSIILPFVFHFGGIIWRLQKQCLDSMCRSTKKKTMKAGDDHDVNTFQLLQSDLNKVYTNPFIQAHYVYSQVIVFMWCALCFSAGMPILYPMACACFTLIYWVYKCLILKYYSIATKFNEDLPVQSVFYLKLGLILHGFVTFFILSSKDILVSQAELSNPRETYEFREEGNIFEKFWYNYLVRPHVLLYLFGWAVLFVCYLLKATLINGFVSCCGALINLCRDNKIKDKSALNDYSDCILKEVQIKCLRDILNKSLKELHDYKALKSHEDNTKVFQFRYREEVGMEYDKVKEGLEQRIESIGKVINEHVRTMYYNYDVDQYDMVMDLNQQQKIQVLAKNQKELIRASGNKVIRLQTQTQSYNLYDSIQFKTNKEVQRLIELSKYKYRLSQDDLYED